MKTKHLIILALFLIIPIMGALANKTSVEVIVPATAEKGQDVTIKINVMHSANTSGHHTDWVYLKVNGQEVKRWTYMKNSLPESNNFTVEFTVKANENLQIEAEGHCNLHGSAGPGTASVKVE